METKNEIKDLIYEIESFVNKDKIQVEYQYIVNKAKAIKINQYSVNLLIKSAKESIKPQKNKINTEGWVSLEKDIPSTLIEYIEKVCCKGYIDIAEKAKIDDETIKLKLNKERAESYVNLKLAEGKLLAEKQKELEIKKQAKSKKQKILVGSFLALITIFALVFFLIIKPALDDAKMERFYVFATGVNFRNSPTSDGDANKIGELPLGAELKLIKDVGEYINVFSVTYEKEGFVHKDYVMSKKDYWELQSIYNDDIANKQIAKSYNRKALLKYFQDNNFVGVVPEEIQKEIYTEEELVSLLGRKIWQFYSSSLEKDNLYSAAAIDLTSNTTDEFVCIIRNNEDLTKYKLIIYNFDDSKAPTLFYEEDLSAKQQILIKVFKKGTKTDKYFFQNTINKEYPKVNGFVIDNDGMKNVYFGKISGGKEAITVTNQNLYEREEWGD